MDNRIDNWGDVLPGDVENFLDAMSSAADDLSPEKRQQILDEQNKAVKMADILLTGVNKLHDKLKVAQSAGEIREHLDHFYGKLFTFMNHFGLSLEDSDAMKLLVGMRTEYENALTDVKFIGSKAQEELNGFFVNFASALQNVNYYRDWKKVDESVSTLVKVTGVEDEEMIDVNFEIECIRADIMRQGTLGVDESRKLTETIAAVKELDRKPISATLDRFAKGEIWLEEIQRVAKTWEGVKAKLDLTSAPEDEESN